MDARTNTSRNGHLSALHLWVCGVFLLLGALVTGSLLERAHAAESLPAEPTVSVIHLDSTIQPVSAWYLDRTLNEAAAAHASAALILMNTPGGLLESMRVMVHSILASPVPVIVYVAPAGSRAGSAGFFLLEAADVAAMAPGTNAGAAHPIIEGAKLDPILKQKLENDATAFLRSFVAMRKRNLAAGQDAVVNSKSYSESEAMQLGLLTLVSPDVPSLLRSLDGQSVTRPDGRVVVLHLRNARLVDALPSIRERILGKLTDPNLALLLLVGGVLLVYLEFNVPGTIIPGAVGTLMVMTALFALNLLPLSYTAVMLLVAALVLLLLEIKVPSHGILAMTGVACLVVGMLTLVQGPVPELRVRVATALGVGTGFGLITTMLVRIALRARRNKVLTGPSSMVGAVAVVQNGFDEATRALGAAAVHPETRFRGQVLVRGEIWLGESAVPVPVGTRLRVAAVRGLTLVVEPMT
ncbi:nodulation protein NfeD [Acidipila sp. EB88]|uniref:NfeD family protein n=1 Tax=Acidipila sp. EB88 TaxID=2305226 RepID=UPI000F5D821B|nr:NfeD family protein [Acidipila sp. EB88]RRA49912.1 nodulation protein NfeD [Acidipila sp. EB88]